MRIEKSPLILMLALSLIVCSTGIAEPVGTAFTYQGRLNDLGEPGDGEYDFRLELYDAALEGNQVGGTIFRTGIPVVGGYFTLEPDFGDVFDGQARWLEISVRMGETEYELLDPRQKVMPAPYALRALKGSYTGEAPIDVDNESNTIGLNAGTSAGDLITWDGNNWINRGLGQVPLHNISNMQPYLGIYHCIALVGVFPSRNSADPMVAEIMLFAGNFPPRGWAFCDGQLLSIMSNTALFSLLGTMYGGDGRTTFGLPDLRGRVAVHPGQGPGLTWRNWGEKSGSETVSR